MQREESMFHDLPAVSYKRNTSPNGTGDNMVKTPDETTPRYAFRELARELDNLLNWAVEPWPNPLDEEWLEGTKRGIHHTARIALNATRDRVIADKVFAANCKGVEFARLLCNRPKLSTIPVEEWTIPKYRLLFDDLAALAREFHWLGQEVTETANEQPDASTPADGERAKKPTTINSRMLDILTKRPESKDWTITEWTVCLNCGRATVHGTTTWKHLEKMRADEAKQRQERGSFRDARGKKTNRTK